MIYFLCISPRFSAFRGVSPHERFLHGKRDAKLLFFTPVASRKTDFVGSFRFPAVFFFHILSGILIFPIQFDLFDTETCPGAEILQRFAQKSLLSPQVGTPDASKIIIWRPFRRSENNLAHLRTVRHRMSGIGKPGTGPSRSQRLRSPGQPQRLALITASPRRRPRQADRPARASALRNRIPVFCNGGDNLAALAVIGKEQHAFRF